MCLSRMFFTKEMKKSDLLNFLTRVIWSTRSKIWTEASSNHMKVIPPLLRLTKTRTKNTETQPVEILKDEAVSMPVDNDETIIDETIDRHHEDKEVDPGIGVVNDETEIGPEAQATEEADIKSTKILQQLIS